MLLNALFLAVSLGSVGPATVSLGVGSPTEPASAVADPGLEQPQAEEVQATRPVSAGSLEVDVDLTLRALRRMQDAETGSFGTSVRITQAALTAFASSHRRYRASDGPFMDRAALWLVSQQRSDGSWIDADLVGGDSQAVAQLRTIGVVGVLDLIGHGSTTSARAKGRAFLGLTTGADLRPDPVAADDKRPTDLLLAEAARLLASRNPDGSWGAEESRIDATARGAMELAALQLQIKAREGAGSANAASTPLPPLSTADLEKTEAALARGGAFLLSARNEEGLWGFRGQTEAGISSMVIASLQALPEPRGEDIEAAIVHGLTYLRSLQKEDGALHDGQLYNYVTSAAVMALSGSKDPADQQLLADARGYLRGLQADEDEGYTPEDRYYGGVGYGGDERPDLSNLNFALEALSTGPADENAEVFQNALVFLQRCQNYSETNDFVVEIEGGSRIESGIDGGATYGPGESKAGYIDLGNGVKVPRSYGSMSYALLRGYLFAGLKKDDPRVQILWTWLQRNYSLDINPGFEASNDPRAAYQGLFYYFFTMARALSLYGEETIVDATGTAHAWRAELAGRLVSMQRQDGSWKNDNSERWYEGNPVLATAYALVTLRETLPK
ncbi:MAG: squalene-hopene/tetraprenyl-beta-curcumene cyclase [Planctomycetota bacterium]|jgi:squalene-hopene/tetraprenyl-beta-curcumene cyclase